MNIEKLQFAHDVCQGINEEETNNRLLQFYAYDGLRLSNALAEYFGSELDQSGVENFESVNGLEIYAVMVELNHYATKNIGESAQDCCCRLSKILRFITECCIGTVNPALCVLNG